MLPAAVAEAVEAHVGAVQRHEPVGGGCIANGAQVETDEGSFFLKWGPEEVAQTFAAEAAGLEALRAAGSPLLVPSVIATQPATDGAPGFLVMEWVAPGRPGPGFDEAFGRGLSALHRHAAERYGFDGDNFIGRLPQRNAWTEVWPDFFRQHRLEPQVERARQGGAWQRAWDGPLGHLYERLGDLLPATPEASMLHGDLWSGNYLVGPSGQAALIDPAAYYGHREADLALTELFGGFGRGFYAGYRAAWPLEAGYEERRAVYNLYHLINHLNHFGGSYAGSVASVLRRFA